MSPHPHLPILFVLLAGSTFAAGADPEPVPKKLTREAIEKAEKAVKDHLEKIKGDYARVNVIADPVVVRTLPGAVCLSVLYPQFPVGRVPPTGLSSSNVLVVGRDGKVAALTSRTSLEKFFREKTPPVTGKEALAAAAEAWVRLSQEFIQDGFYKFVLEKSATKVTQGKELSSVEAKTVVMAGGNGYLSVRLDFGRTGKLTSAAEKSAVRPGPRPRCQATKLLDPDPIVRKMAEEHLLYLGRPAKGYLDEQRAKASPELKKAIDRIWERIQQSDE